jgi:hypothetical protein
VPLPLKEKHLFEDGLDTRPQGKNGRVAAADGINQVGRHTA